MPTQDQTVSLNLAGTIDQKDDEFAGLANTYEVLQDWTWDKDKRLKKRPGSDELSTDVRSGLPGPTEIVETDIPNDVESHENQLLLQNNGGLFSYDDDNEEWVFKGNYYPVEVKTETVVSEAENVFNPAVAVTDSAFIYAFIRLDGYSNLTYLTVKVVDRTTGAVVIQYDVSTSGTPILPKLCQFSDAVVLTYIDFSGGTYVLKARAIDLATFAIGTANTLESSITYAVNSGYGLRTAYDVTSEAYTKTGVTGQRAFFTARNGSQIVVRAFDNTGAVDSGITAYTLSATVVAGGGIYYNADADRIYIAWTITSGSNYVTNVYGLTFSSSAIALGFTYAFDTSSNAASLTSEYFKQFVFAKDPVTPAQTYFFACKSNIVTISSRNAERSSISYGTFDASGNVLPKTFFCVGAAIMAKPVTDTRRETIYLPLEYTSTLQSAVYIADVLRGKFDTVTNQFYAIAKINYRTHLTVGGMATQAMVLSDDVLHLPSRIATRINTVNSVVSGSTAVYQSGASLTRINLLPEKGGSYAYMNRTTHATGGILWAYDGAQMVEHGFLNQPEDTEGGGASAFVSGIRYTVITRDRTAGSGSTPTIYDCDVLYPAWALANLTAFDGGAVNYNNLILNFGATNDLVEVRFTVAGISPKPQQFPSAAYQVNVTLSGNECRTEVRNAIVAALLAASVPFTITVTGSTSFRATNNVNGDIVTVSSCRNDVAGPAAGTRIYCAIWSWIDENGQQYRSATSRTVSVTTGEAVAIFLNFQAPPLTNRYVSDVKVELYSTVSGGSTFYRLKSTNALPPWSDQSAGVGFIVTEADSSFSSNEILYTTGGILPNNSIGPCTHVATVKDRLVTVDGYTNLVRYSKTAQNFLPVEIAESMFLQISNDGDPAKAVQQLDDKWIVFKGKGITAYGGDGSNDLGVNVSFSQPLNVPTDVGIKNPNSIAVTPQGIWFDSLMGIQVLTRALQTAYVGEAVKDFNTKNVARAVILKDSKDVREVRFLMNDSALAPVFSYIRNLWTTYSNYLATGACNWQGKFVRVNFSGEVKVDSASKFYDDGPTPTSYSPVFKTAWLKLKGMQDFQRIKRMMLLGALKSAHTLGIKAYTNYDTVNFDEYEFDSANIAGAAKDATVYEPEFHLKTQKCDSVQFEVTAVPEGGTEESLTVTDMSFLVGLKKGLMKTSKAKKA